MRIEIFDSIQKISASLWEDLRPRSFPFADYQFLLALEQTDCLGRRTGWTPFYICSWSGDELWGVFLIFAKSNSYGEYIFDFAWAQAFEQSQLPYYPKFVAAIPFTPATGPKILLSQKLSISQRIEVARDLLRAAKALCTKTKASSLHALFISEDEIETFQENDFFIRHSFQYHWLNESFKSFEDFLVKLRSKRRKEILRERQQARQSQAKISRLTGGELKPEHARLMYQFYRSTVEKMGGFPYLTEAFFEQVFDKMSDQILFVLAESPEGLPVAGALNYFGDSTLFGRHWGCLEEYRALHFEICYYQGIEFAIEKNFKLFEAGAQGEHKFQRGFLPRLTYSAHRIEDPRLGQAIFDFVETEKKNLELLFRDYDQQTPFSRERA